MNDAKEREKRNTAVETPLESDFKPRARLRAGSDPLTGGKNMNVPPQKMGRLKDKIESVGEIRAQKIAPIKKAVAQGAYRVDSEKIAKRVVNEAANDALHRGKCGLDRWPQDAD